MYANTKELAFRNAYTSHCLESCHLARSPTVQDDNIKFLKCTSEV